MSALTIELPDDQLARLKQLARSRGLSVEKLVEMFATRIIAESDAFTQFQLSAVRGETHRALEMLDKLDHHFTGSSSKD